MKKADHQRDEIQSNRKKLLSQISKNSILYSFEGECFEFLSREERLEFIEDVLKDDQRAYLINTNQQIIIEITEEYTDIVYFQNADLIEELATIVQNLGLYFFKC